VKTSDENDSAFPLLVSSMYYSLKDQELTHAILKQFCVSVCYTKFSASSASVLIKLLNRQKHTQTRWSVGLYVGFPHINSGID
jgi:hypothetical protein